MIQNWLNSAAIIGIAAYLGKEYRDRKQEQRLKREQLEQYLDSITEDEDGTIHFSMGK